MRGATVFRDAQTVNYCFAAHTEPATAPVTVQAEYYGRGPAVLSGVEIMGTPMPSR